MTVLRGIEASIISAECEIFWEDEVGVEREENKPG
jgi:hypothetical protein